MKQKITRLVLGIATVLIAVVCIFYLLQNVLKIYEVRVLKWLPILSTFVGFYLAGKLTKNLRIKYLAYLLPALLIFIPVNFFYLPFLFILLFTAVWALALNRWEINRNIKYVMSIIGIGIFTFFLFNQPLIIQKDGFKKAADGTLYNARVLWDKSGDEVNVIPNETYVNFEKEEVRLADLEGKIVYVSFWATWCGPCKAEKPKLDRLKEEFKDHDKVVFVDISLDKNQATWQAYLEKHKPSGIQWNSKNEGLTRRNFEFVGIPHHVIVNASGQYKSHRDVPTAATYLENEELLNNWIAQGRLVESIPE